MVREEFLAAARQWMAGCTQLTAAGIVWNDVEPERVSVAWPAWRDSAHRSRRRQLAELSQRLNNANAVSAETRAARTHHDFQSLVDRAGETASAADETRRAYATAQSGWLQSLTGWVSGLTWLPAQGGALPPIDQYDPPAWNAWAKAALDAHTAHSGTAEVDLQQRQRAHDLAQHQCAKKHQQLTRERDELAADTAGAPPVPVTRLDSRDGRPGAALYALVDFTQDVDPERMPGLEAAVFASGLADAWLHPDGVLSSESGTPLADTQLDPATKPIERALSTVLRPDTDAAHAAGLPAATITAVLASIGLAETASDAPGELALGWDGTWRAGPLHGAYRQQSAILIGAARRERVRQARLAALDQELADLAGKLHEFEVAEQDLAAEAEQLRAAREQARVEADGVPPTNAVDQAERRAEEAERAAREALDRARRGQPEMHAALSQLHQQRTNDLAAIAATSPVPGSLQLSDVVDALTPSPSLTELDNYARASAAMLDAITTVSEEAREGLRIASEVTEQEHGSFPPVFAALQDREQQASRAEQAQKTAQTQFSERRKKHKEKLAVEVEQKQIVGGALAEAGLAEWETRLHDLLPKIDSWMADAEDWLTALNTQRLTAVEADRASRAASEAAAVAAEEVKRATTDKGRAVAARKHYTNLADRIGTDYTSLVAEIADLESQIKETGESLKENWDAQLLKGGQHQAAEERALADAEAHQQVIDALPALAEKLWAAVNADLPRAAGWDMPTTADEDSPVERATTTALHIQDLAGSDAARQYGSDLNDDRAAEVYKLRHAAEASLRGRLTLVERPSAEILIIEAVRDDRTATLPATIASLNTEVIGMQVMLSDEESKLLEQFLTDSIRRQVIGHIEAARKQIKNMSEAMQGHRTSAGYRFALDWVPAPGTAVNDQVLDLLNADFGVAPSAKERLRDFFAARIAAIRATRSGQTWETLLEEMLDYRSWYQFQLLFAKGGSEFAVLDNTHFDKLSGGEKSVALHLPLFAAAATHTVAAVVRDSEDPEKPGCPRLILLDEVFAGVDEDMRGELFDLVTSLDMDLVATSEAETGMYAELDGIAIYHLIRSPGVPGVLAARSVWTGSDAITLLDNDLEQGL
ncbi:SbcC/MukB-like Walker B domain-containing protein [Micromonospora azadirachtae]|uniref:SbcC/MukB-like Walker B domain-containing protein n=1 Tax=Micromonospora azadirachtae TaxID=1970735 RepID=A0ABW2ZUJ6_9ACTN